MTRGPCSGVMVPALRGVGMPLPAALAFATHTMGPRTSVPPFPLSRVASSSAAAAAPPPPPADRRPPSCWRQASPTTGHGVQGGLRSNPAVRVSPSPRPVGTAQRPPRANCSESGVLAVNAGRAPRAGRRSGPRLLRSPRWGRGRGRARGAFAVPCGHAAEPRLLCHRLLFPVMTMDYFCKQVLYPLLN